MNNIFKKFNFDISAYQEYKLKQQKIIDYFDKIQNFECRKVDSLDKLLDKIFLSLFILLTLLIIIVLYDPDEKSSVIVVILFLASFFGVGFVLLVSFISYDFLYNLVTFGKRNKILDKVQKIEKNITKKTRKRCHFTSVTI